MNTIKKIRNSRILVAAISTTLSLAIVGCSSTPVAAPTPYKSANSKTAYGYSSEKVSENEYKILFKATDKTPADKVQQYALYRAAEIAQEQGYSYLTVLKTNVDKKPIIAREVMAGKEKPAVFQTDRQCTMSGCNEVAQPMATPNSSDVVKTRINDIYFTINVRVSKDKASLGKSAFLVQEVLAEPLKPNKG
jgi:hypothetical protein